MISLAETLYVYTVVHALGCLLCVSHVASKCIEPELRSTFALISIRNGRSRSIQTPYHSRVLHVPQTPLLSSSLRSNVNVTMPGDRVGQRTSFSSQLCTVRYIGPLEGQSGTWLGVEWDDPSRGKNNGELKGRHYFDCKK